MSFLVVVAAVAQEPGTSVNLAEGSLTNAQPAPTNTAATQIAPPSLQGDIQFVGPDTYILLDKQGRPQALPGMTYEDFMAAWKQAQNMGSEVREPRFTIESVQVDGRTLARHAELRFNAIVHVVADGPVDVPLGLLGAVLQRQAEFQRGLAAVNYAKDQNNQGNVGPAGSDPYVDYDPNGGGFVAHFSGSAGDRYTVSLSLLVPLANDGGGTTLALTFPRAVFSKLTLQVNSPVAEATVMGGTLVAKELSDEGTRLDVAGVMGPVRLTWQTLEARSEEYATVLSAEGAIRVAIDGRSVRNDARLTVRSYGGSFDRFRVRLPRGAQLIRRQPSDAAPQAEDYRVSLEESSPAGSPVGAIQQIVLVELPEAQRGPVVIDLRTEQPLGLDDYRATELDGFEVIGAVRQFGDLALLVASDWQSRWNMGRYVRQVDHDEIDPLLQSPELTAAFQYDRQPWTIGLKTTPRQFRTLVTPSYDLQCTPEEAQLTVRLAYQVLGGRAFDFQVRLQGWELTAGPLESGGLVDREQVSIDNELLTLPLVQGSSRRADISFTLRRALPRDAGRLRLTMPVPIADSVSTGQLVVRPIAGLNLLPDLTNSVGLAPVVNSDPAGSLLEGDGNDFRFRCMLPEVVFAADRIERARDVLTEVTMDAMIAATEARMRQRIHYAVRHEPIKELTFDAPLALLVDAADLEFVEIQDGDDVAVDQEEMPLSFTLAASDNSLRPSITRQVRVSLPQPRIGSFTIEARSRLEQPNKNGFSNSWKLPLVRPAEAAPRLLEATIHGPQNATVAIDSQAGATSWKQASPTRTDRNPASFVFTADSPEMYLPCVLTAGQNRSAGPTTVERIWLQTWIAREMRQDRAAFRLKTSASRVAVELAPQTPPGDIEVLVDRQPAKLVTREGGQLVVQLLPESRDGASARSAIAVPYTLELRYRRPIGQALLTRHVLTPPQIIGTTALSDIYWQIILPGDQHIVRSPAQLSAATEWQWLGSFWGRRPVRSQTELEQWVGASDQLTPASTQNAYLFSGLAPLASIELVTAPRWLIVSVASGGALLLALAWIYVPVLRRGWILAGWACVLVGLAVAYPTAAVLLAQAALLGVLLAMLAGFMYRVLARPSRWTVVVPATPSATRQSTARPDSIVLPPVPATASTAPTASVRMPNSN